MSVCDDVVFSLDAFRPRLDPCTSHTQAIYLDLEDPTDYCCEAQAGEFVELEGNNFTLSTSASANHVPPEVIERLLNFLAAWYADAPPPAGQ